MIMVEKLKVAILFTVLTIPAPNVIENDATNQLHEIGNVTRNAFLNQKQKLFRSL
jgi:hypothetical protein